MVDNRHADATLGDEYRPSPHLQRRESHHTDDPAMNIPMLSLSLESTESQHAHTAHRNGPSQLLSVELPEQYHAVPAHSETSSRSPSPEPLENTSPAAISEPLREKRSHGAANSRRTPNSRSRFLGSIFRKWWFECLCCVLAILALLAVALTLSIHQGRPLPQWPYKVTINSLVSVYVVVMKAAMLVVVAEGTSTPVLNPSNLSGDALSI